MFARSVVLRAARPARQLKPYYRAFASAADRATSSPQGTHGGTTPPEGDPKGNKDNTLLYAAGAVGFLGVAYWLMSGSPNKAEANKAQQSNARS
ncbi:hypothetical protein CONLIGDRAFT_717874 [Coniochaeta ligniaria NRRL 30616]|uniref:Uncharacterized protein n=1 Tax=Coniochaeta ligniaria NRRL 30616 TaxID=1408157 RepID=A0A1J7IBR7_9PEZI|nr:hypothetical protein CONLIGDRAFT_717874 [Coniochaeta ligniaria NRRL 30616]